MAPSSLHSIQLPFQLFLIAPPPWTRRAPAFSIPCSPILFPSRTKRAHSARVRCLRSLHVLFRRDVTRCAIDRPERYDATDWARALRTLPRSVVLRRIRGHIVANTAVATVVCVVYEVLLRLAPDIVHHFNITPLPHTFMTTAMSLLLVLRSNAAYDRFWEGRKLWGSVINISRNMARMCTTCLPKTHANAIGILAVCYCYALMHHVQGRREEQPFINLCAEVRVPVELQRKSDVHTRSGCAKLKHFADADMSGFNQADRFCTLVETDYGWNEWRTRVPSELELVARINNAENKPLEVLLQLSTLVKLSVDWKVLTLRKSEVGQTLICTTAAEGERLENCIYELMEIMGKCERIVQSPVPASWNRHTSRMISLWTLTLPLVLVPIQGVLAVPTIAVMSWVLFSVEEIGHLVEDPFRQERYSIQLEDICDDIRKEVMEQILCD